MLAALALPRLLESLHDRLVMFAGAFGLVSGLLLSATVSFWGLPGWGLFHAIWFVLGLSYSAVLTPSGRLLRRSSHQSDRPALYAAQFALSHACWVVAYPLAGWLGAGFGMGIAFLGLGGLAVSGIVTALVLWPTSDFDFLVHAHPDLPPDHPHWLDGTRLSAQQHSHEFVIDDLHHRWPSEQVSGHKGCQW